MNKLITATVALYCSMAVYAGGNPEFVRFPDNYAKKFIHYDTVNRSNGKQLARLYANTIALQSANSNELANGSKIVMEVYTIILDTHGKPKQDTNGLFIKSKLAAVAVMEKQAHWNTHFPEADRAGDWGFAIYQPTGVPKENDLDCAACHTPLKGQDYRFSHAQLQEYINNQP